MVQGHKARERQGWDWMTPGEPAPRLPGPLASVLLTVPLSFYGSLCPVSLSLVLCVCDNDLCLSPSHFCLHISVSLSLSLSISRSLLPSLSPMSHPPSLCPAPISLSLSVCLSVFFCVSLSLCLSLCLFLSVSVSLSLCLSVCLSVPLPSLLSTHPPQRNG